MNFGVIPVGNNSHLAMDFFKAYKDREVIGPNRADKLNDYFVSLTAFPGNTAVYSFDNISSMYSFCYRTMKEIQGSRIANLNKNNYLFERIYANQMKVNPSAPGSVILDVYENFPKVDYGTKAQYEFFESHYDSIMSYCAFHNRTEEVRLSRIG